MKNDLNDLKYQRWQLWPMKANYMKLKCKKYVFKLKFEGVTTVTRSKQAFSNLSFKLLKSEAGKTFFAIFHFSPFIVDFVL